MMVLEKCRLGAWMCKFVCAMQAIPSISPSCLIFCFSLPFISSPYLLPSSVSPSLISPFSFPFILHSYLYSNLSPYYLLPLVLTFFLISSSTILLTFSSSYCSFPPSSPTCPNRAGYKVLLIQFDRDGRHVMVCAR